MLRLLVTENLPATHAFTQSHDLAALVTTHAPLDPERLGNGYAAHAVNLGLTDCDFDNALAPVLAGDPQGVLPDTVRRPTGAAVLALNDELLVTDTLGELAVLAQLHSAGLVRLFVDPDQLGENIDSPRDRIDEALQQLDRAARCAELGFTALKTKLGVKTFLRLPQGCTEIRDDNENDTVRAAVSAYLANVAIPCHIPLGPTHAVHLACPDYRFEGQLRAATQGTSCAAIRRPGGAFKLVSNAIDAAVRRHAVEELITLADRNRTGIIRLFMHENCGAIKLHHEFDNRDAQIRFLIERLLQAGEITQGAIAEKGFDMAVETYLRLQEGVVRIGKRDALQSLLVA